MNSRTVFRTECPSVRRAPLTAIVGIVVLVGPALGPSTVGERSQALAEGNGKERVMAKTLFGFTPFPCDQTLEALAKTHQIVTANSTIYALHYDDGIPWKEALGGRVQPPATRRGIFQMETPGGIWMDWRAGEKSMLIDTLCIAGQTVWIRLQGRQR